MTHGRHLCLLGDANSVHLRRWAHEMQARGWTVSVVTARPQPLPGVEQRVLRPVQRQSDWLWRVGGAREQVAQLAPDIVHAHYVTSYGYLAARCGWHPLVMTAWGSDLLVTPRVNRALSWLTGWTLRRADLITGDSAELVAAAEAYRPRAPVRLVHWGVDTERFAPAPWADKPGFEIVSPRNWEPNYNTVTVLQAFAALQRARPGLDARLHLMGGGPQEALLRERAAELSLGEATVFHGRLDDAGMGAVLARCKVSVSVPTSDATSVALLESMACGLAVLASDLPANRAWLDASAGVLVPAGDAAALARALQRLADDDAVAKRLGEANRERIARDGERRVQMDAMARLYDGLLACAGGRT